MVSKQKKIPLILSDYGGLTTHPDIEKGSFLKRMAYKLQSPIIKFVMNQASMVIAANEYEEKDYTKFVNRKKITIVRNGIDFNGLQKNPFGFKLKHNIDGRMILFVGRFDKVKGIDLLLNAFYRLSNDKQFLDVYLVIMGSNFGFKNKMIELIKKFRIKNRVRIIEDSPREDIIAAYHACEFLVLPSRWELSPLTPLEGFACKKPSISTNAAGIPFVVENQQTGILIEPENIDNLSESIKDLLGNKEKLLRLGNNGYNTVREKFNSSDMVKKIEKIYEEIINVGSS